MGTSMSASIATPSRWIGCGRLGMVQFPRRKRTGSWISLRIQSPSEDGHYHDESVSGPPNHHVTMGLDP